jgi:hypothetical protein
MAVAFVLVAIDGNGAEEMTPFSIPPHGKPELLLGNIDLEAPTAMAFDSRNRPYLLNCRNPKSFGKIRTVRDGEWVTLSVSHLFERSSVPTERNMHAPGTIVIDDSDGIYVSLGGKLIYSSPGRSSPGSSW